MTKQTVTQPPLLLVGSAEKSVECSAYETMNGLNDTAESNARLKWQSNLRIRSDVIRCHTAGSQSQLVLCIAPRNAVVNHMATTMYHAYIMSC